MDLNATHLADNKTSRLARVSMMVCFVIASDMLLASLAMAHGTKSQSLTASTPSLSASLH